MDDFDFTGIGTADIDDEDFVPIDQLDGGGEAEGSDGDGDPDAAGGEPEDEKQKQTGADSQDGEDSPDGGGQGRQTENNNRGDGEPDGHDGEGSPDQVSSIALALMDLKKVGALRTLDDDILKSVKDASGIKDVILQEVQNLRNEDQKRIADALSSGVSPNVIQYYENEIKKLEAYDQSRLDDEGDDGEAERRYYLTLQYKLKNYSDEDIKELVDKSFESARDKEDAKKAFEFVKTSYDTAYKNAIAQAKEERERQIEASRKHAEEMKESIMNGKGYLETLKVDKDTRMKIFDYIGKPEYEMMDANGKPMRDGSGQVIKMSALTKFCREHLDEANQILATWLVLTDEGKDFGRLFKGPVDEETKKINRRLEDNLINGTRRHKDGSFAGDEGISVAVDFDEIAGLG